MLSFTDIRCDYGDDAGVEGGRHGDDDHGSLIQYYEKMAKAIGPNT